MDVPLGKTTEYRDTYAPEVLAPMSRADARQRLGLTGTAPFVGEDVWNGYEFSWLGPKGGPRVAGLRFVVDAGSPSFVESKSLKLYLNGFAQTRFASDSQVTARLEQDLGAAFGAVVCVTMVPLDGMPAARDRLPGYCLDQLDEPVDVYQRAPGLLELTRGGDVARDLTLHTHLFRSLCPVTGQPDWASVLVRYSGPAIEPLALWRYLLSYRCHQAFHETTIEQIFLDLAARCRCERLLVAGFFQRRGGLDINPMRTNGPKVRLRYRLPRQ
jgi:7-cyano-7-deazaguanine reductase